MYVGQFNKYKKTRCLANQKISTSWHTQQVQYD